MNYREICVKSFENSYQMKFQKKTFKNLKCYDTMIQNSCNTEGIMGVTGIIKINEGFIAFADRKPKISSSYSNDNLNPALHHDMKKIFSNENFILCVAGNCRIGYERIDKYIQENIQNKTFNEFIRDFSIYLHNKDEFDYDFIVAEKNNDKILSVHIDAYKTTIEIVNDSRKFCTNEFCIYLLIEAYVKIIFSDFETSKTLLLKTLNKMYKKMEKISKENGFFNSMDNNFDIEIFKN